MAVQLPQLYAELIRAVSLRGGPAHESQIRGRLRFSFPDARHDSAMAAVVARIQHPSQARLCDN
jgi:hypothetical protein